MKTAFRNAFFGLWTLFNVGILMVCMPAMGQANTWDNESGDSNWNNALNWDLNGIPDGNPGAGDVLINGNSSVLNPVMYSAGTETIIRQLLMSGGASDVSALSITGAGSIITTPDLNISIGGAGTATVAIGSGAALRTTAAGAGVIVGNGSGSSGTVILSGGSLAAGGAIAVRNNSGANGTIRGYGSVISNRGLSEFIVNNGKVIADGGGTDHVLTLASTGFGSNAVTSTIENTTDNGYYATNHGKVSFTSGIYNSSGTYTWGDASGDATIDMVNSARVSFIDAAAHASITGSLLALDRTDAHAVNGDASGDQFVGYWNFSLTTGSIASLSLMQLRYDDALISSLGAAEGDLSLYYYDTGTSEWTLLSGTIDEANNIFSSTSGSYAFGDYALGVTAVPEPSVWALLIGGLIFLVTARKRRTARMA